MFECMYHNMEENFLGKYMHADVIPEQVHTSSSIEGISLYDLFCVPIVSSKYDKGLSAVYKLCPLLSDYFHSCFVNFLIALWTRKIHDMW